MYFRLNLATLFVLLTLLTCIYTRAEPATTDDAESANSAGTESATIESIEESDASDDGPIEDKINTQSGAMNQNAVQVDWYQPEIGLSPKPNFVRVILLGKTAPFAKAQITTEEIVLISKKGKIRAIKSKVAFPKREAIADDRGILEMSMNLPVMTAQIPIEVTYPSGKSRRYQISLDVQKSEVRLNNANAKGSPYARRNWGIWAGMGFNYLKYEQTTTIPSDLVFESFMGPSLYFKFFKAINKEWAAQVTYNKSPGKTQASNSIKLNQGQYDWTFYTTELTYFKPEWMFRYQNYLTHVGMQGGIQYHIVPFITRNSTSDPAVTTVTTNEIMYATFGGTWLIHYDRYWLFETFLRYQYPISSGETFDVTPKFAFDGSLGVIYKWKPDLRVGVFWYGQWHQYDFSNHTDTYLKATGGDPNVSGSQTLFFSNLELRLGWEFD